MAQLAGNMVEDGLKISGALSSLGIRGYSAYELAVKNGLFSGTETEWVNSLKSRVETKLEDNILYYKYDDSTEWIPILDLNSIKQDITDINAELLGKVEKRDGYSLISNAEISRLSTVTNYNDSEIRGMITTLSSLINENKNSITSIYNISLPEIVESVIALRNSLSDYRTAAEQDTIDNAIKTELNEKAKKTEIPTRLSQLSNDSGYLTEHQDLSDYAQKNEIPDVSSFITKSANDLVNYFTKSEVYTKEDVNSLISMIPRFGIQVVNSLPTENISTTTIYLLNDGDQEGNLCTEYLYINGKWEILGSQQVDLTGYATEEYVNTKLSTFITEEMIQDMIPKNISSFTNDVGYIISETDPTVPSWAKQPSKPKYTAEEVGALSSSTNIPIVEIENNDSLNAEIYYKHEVDELINHTNSTVTSIENDLRELQNGDVNTITGEIKEDLSDLSESIKEMIEKQTNKTLAVSNAKNITIDVLNLNSIEETFIKEYKLLDPMNVKNLVQIANGDVFYYSSFENAVNDLNNDVVSGAISDSTIAKVVLCKNDNGINIIQLIQDITINSAINILKPLFIDINGKTITSSFVITQSNFLMLYGYKNGSTITNVKKKNINFIMQALKSHETSLYIVGCKVLWNYEQTSTIECFIVTTVSNIYIKGISYTALTGDTILENNPGFMMVRNGNQNPIVTIEDSVFDATFKSKKSGAFIQCSNVELLKILNCKINYTQIVDNIADNTSFGIKLGVGLSSGTTNIGKGICIIKNCIISATNYAVGFGYGKSFIENCILYGAGHGGIYSSRKSSIQGKLDDWNTTIYVKDSTLGLKQQDGKIGNAYSCYIGYDSMIYFNNCKFTSYNNQYNGPAIKTGNGDPVGSIYKNTQAYFSNCEMSSIRVDEDCRAYMGLGMSDELKHQSVSGEIIDTGNDSYSFNLIEM